MRISDWSSDVCSSDLQAGRRPGDVEEQADPVLQPVRAEPLAQRQEMIILHPDQIFRLDQRDQAVRELLVDALIAHPELILIFGQVDAIVKQRPQRAVGIAVVIFLDVMGFQVDRRGGEAVGRSEEHTSELQSLMRISYAVFCLKKKKTL